MNRPYLTCREVIEYVLAYLAHELDAAERHEFERHLAVCPSCVAYLHSYERTVELAHLAFADDEDDGAAMGVPPELVEAVLAARRG